MKNLNNKANKMKNFNKVTLLLILSMVSVFASNEMKVEKLVDRAINQCTKIGLEECVKLVNNKNPMFMDKSFYIFISKLDGKMLAHGGNKNLAGKNLMKVMSPSGVYPARLFHEIITTKGFGWTEYKWSHPVTRKSTPKRAYVKKYNNEDIFIGSGYYLK